MPWTYFKDCVLEMLFPRPHFFCLAKRNGKESRPGFPGQGFALRRPPFRSCEKEAKARLGAKIRVRHRLPKCGSLAHRIFPLRTPRFYGGQGQGSATSYSRRWGKPTLPAPSFRCRSTGGHSTLLGPRDTPGADGPSRLGALPWAVEGASLVGTSGSGRRRFVCPDFMRRSIGRRTEGLVSAFLWISKTVSFGAYKRNGFWRFDFKGASLWLLPSFRTSEKSARPHRKKTLRIFLFSFAAYYTII